jgi:hypothetical protein
LFVGSLFSVFHIYLCMVHQQSTHEAQSAVVLFVSSHYFISNILSITLPYTTPPTTQNNEALHLQHSLGIGSDSDFNRWR